ncbi:MAG: thermonuclease family protein [Pseudomonadota bacterium]|nr:thermonuclease family protein [Pseudomonadota bacterium]
MSQAFGNQSKKSLSDIVFGKSVKVVQEDVDRYGRTVGRVYVNGINVSAEQVKRGMAWVYRKYGTDKGLYVLENSAKTPKAGLWLDPHAIYRPGNTGTEAAGATSGRS